MRRRGNDNSMEPGQDSFLDVVANLVGILIILVVLIGSQARSVWEKARSENDVQSPAIVAMAEKVQGKISQRSKLESENIELEESIQQQKMVAAQLGGNRDRLQLLVQAVNQTIEERRKKMDVKQRKRADLIATVNQLKTKYAQVTSYASSLEGIKPQIGTIDHLPTPIAKTVFGEEVHFRLQGGRIAYVPMNELIVEMQSEWKVKAKKLVQTSSTTETVGPMMGFRLQYTLELKKQTRKTEHGTLSANVPALKRFFLIPIGDGLGEPVEQALTPGSKFLQRINGLDPGEATISIWVYPESFEWFNRIKKELYQRKFLCAGWPLPANQPISASPDGFRAAAQ